MEKILVTNDKYEGKYIALKSPEDDTIVGSGQNPQEALAAAKANGEDNPFLFYVPDSAIIQIY